MNSLLTIVPNDFQSKVQLNQIHAKCVTEVNGFTHYHFKTPTYNLKRLKEKAVTLGSNLIRVEKVKNNKVIKLTNKEFDSLLSEFGWVPGKTQNNCLDQPTIPKPEKLTIICKKEFLDEVLKRYEQLRAFEYMAAFYGNNNPAQVLNNGHLESVARARNRLMHALNGNTETGTGFARHYILNNKTYFINLVLCEDQVNELYDIVESDDGTQMDIKLYIFYKNSTRVKMEIDHIMNFEFDGKLARRNKFFKVLTPALVPIKLHRSNVSYYIENKRVFLTTTSGFFINLDVHDFKVECNEVTFELNEFARNQYDQIQHKEDRLVGDKIIKVQEREQLSRTTIWSNHTDYDPTKRCIISCKNSIKVKFFGMREPDEYLEGSDSGSWQYNGVFLLVPKKTFIYRFSKTNYTDDLVNVNLYRKVLSSVSQQKMTLEQVAKTALMLTRIQVSYIDFEQTYDCIFSIIYLLIKANINVLTVDKGYSYSIGEIWDTIFRTSTAFEVFDIEHEKSINTRLDFVTKQSFELSFASLQALANNYFASIEDINDINDLIKLYKAGVLTALQNCVRPLKWHVSKMQTSIYRDDPELNEEQLFITNIIESNMDEVDLTKCINYALTILETQIARGEIKNISKFKDIILKLAKFRFDSMYQPGINKLVKEIKQKEEIFEMSHINLGNKMLINKEMQTEKTLVSVMSSHYFSFANILGIRPGNSPFNTVNYLFKTHKRLRTKVKQCSDETSSSDDDDDSILDGPPPSEIDDDDDETKDGYFIRAFRRIRAPFDHITNAFTKVYNLGDTIDEVKLEVLKKIDDVANQYDTVQMKNVASSLKKLDFTTIRNGYYSIESLIKSFINDLLNKIGTIFGIKLECQLEPSKLFAYYILWNNTDSRTVKYYIIGSIAVELGIMDLIASLIGKLYQQLKNLFTPKHVNDEQPTTSTQRRKKNRSNESPLVSVNSTPVDTDCMNPDMFKNILQGLKVSNKKITKENVKQLKVQKQNVEDVLIQQDEDTESWLDYILEKIKKGTPLVIGTVAVAAALALGVKVASSNDKLCIGNQIINGMRNLSFIGLGVAAVPKIFKYAMAVINWIVEKAKELLNKDYLSVDRYIKKVTDWLKTTNYCRGVTEHQFVRNTTFTARFIEKFIEMRELITNEVLLFDMTSLKMAFGKRVELMTQLYPIAVSSMQIALGNHEIFHIQLTSQPGYGKTDLCQQLLKTLEADFRKLEGETAKAIKMPRENFSTGVYPIKETLNYNDMYYGQNFALLDDDYIFSNPPLEQITDKMFLLSGFPCISHQASLSDKGRLFDIKVMLSNTNNPYMRPQNMLNPQALHRRRYLFRVKLKQRYAKSGPSDNEWVVDNEKIVEDGINRTAGEHLVIDYIDSLEDKVVEIDGVKMCNMSVLQAKEFMTQLLIKHYQTEERRLLNRDGNQCYARIAYEKLMQDLKHWDIELEAGEMLSTASVFTRINKKIDEYKCNSDNEKDKKYHESVKRKYRSDLTILQSVLPFINEEDDVASELTTQQVAFFGPVSEDTKYKLGIRKIDNQKYYYLQPGDAIARRGPINFDKFKIYEFTKNVPQPYNMLFYPVGDSDDIHSILFWLVNLSSCRDKKHLEGEIRVRKLENKKAGKLKIWREKLKIIHYNTLAVCEKALKFLTKCAINLIGRPLFQGVIVGVTVVGMFYTLKTIGQLLVGKTEQVAYTTVNKTTRLPTSPARHPQPTQQVRNEVETEQPFTPFVAKQQKYGDVPLSNTEDAQFLRNATYKIRYYSVNNKNQYSSIIGTIIGLQGNLFLTCRHTVTKIKESATPVEIEIYDPKFATNPQFTIKKYYIRNVDVQYIKDQDAAIICISGFRATRNIVEHFVSENDLGHDMQNFVTGNCLSILLRKEVFTNNDPSFAKWRTTGWSQYNRRFNYNETDVAPDRVIEFSSKTDVVTGDSGSLVMHDNNLIQRKFLGIIFAVGDVVFVNVITKEQIEKTMVNFSSDKKIVVTVTSEEVLPEAHELYNVFKYKDELYVGPYGNLGISQSSGFRKTNLHNKFEESKEHEVFPAIQNLNDPRWQPGTRHPFYVSLNKTAGEKNPTFDLEEEKFMKSALEHMYVVHTPGITQIRSFNTTEAIIGVKMRGSTSMNTKTTPGLPYSLKRAKRGKTDFIHFHEDTQSWQINNFVYNEVDYYESMYAMGKVPQNYKLEFLKKELVPIAKIEDPKTRTVATGNMIHQIIYNKLFKNLYIFFKNSWDYGNPTPIALGLDPPRHWHMITQHLKYLDYVMDFDVKAWEEKLNLRLMTMNAEVKTKLYQDAYKSRNQKIDLDYNMLSKGLVVDYTDANVCFRDIMYRKASGLLSGHPGTLMENSEIHYMILNLIAYRILRTFKPQWANVQFIYDHVKCILAADDVLIAVSPLARTFVTCERIVDGYSKLGFEVTSADKKSEIKPKTINEVQFLKNSFKNVEGIYYPKPNMSIIIQLFSWYREDSALSPHEQMQVNRENAFAQLWWRGRDDYERIRKEFNLLMMKNNYQWSLDYDSMAKLLEQQSLDEQYMSRQPNSSMEDGEAILDEILFD